MDEIQWQRGHKYLTLVYQIEDGMPRLLWVAEDRTEERLRGFFRMFGTKPAVDPFRVQRHVAAVPEGDCQEARRPSTCWTASTSWRR